MCTKTKDNVPLVSTAVTTNVWLTASPSVALSTRPCFQDRYTSARRGSGHPSGDRACGDDRGESMMEDMLYHCSNRQELRNAQEIDRLTIE